MVIVGLDLTRFALLGPLRATQYGQEIPLGPAKQQAVLGVLLSRASWPVPRDEIVAGVWGEAAPASAGNLVATYVAGLRRALEPRRSGRDNDGIILSTPSGYLLRAEPEQIDLRLFNAEVVAAQQARDLGDLEGCVRSLATALERWRGPALEGVPGPHAGQLRAQLAERRQTALEQRIEVDITRGHHSEWVSELPRLIAEHPLREPLYAMLMLALQRSGRQAEALTVFENARRHLAAELGVEPGVPLRQVFQSILANDHAPATPFAPRQLPADVPDFTGRTPEIERLSARLMPSETPVVCVLTGAAGVGKTALAVRVAHRISGRFPDGQLFLNVCGIEPAELLARMLGDLGVPANRLPPSVDRRAALLRTVLCGRRMLIVLDGVTDPGQASVAIPGTGGSAVLITSALRTVEVPGAGQFPLGHLDADAAKTLFAAIVGADRAVAEPLSSARILEYCGGSPAALRAVGTKLLDNPLWTLRTVAARLEDERRPFDELTLAAG